MELKIRDYIQEHKEEIFHDLVSLCEVEASTAEVENLAEVRAKLIEIIQRRLGGEPEVIEVESTRNCVYSKLLEGNGKNEQPILMMGHYDTVHPRGKISVRKEGDILFGPGVFDMKGGIIEGIWACKAVKDLGLETNYPVHMLNNGDEETSSKDSVHILIERAEGVRAALILESAMENGDCKTGRKGQCPCTIKIYGKASHAGLRPEEGINAILEASHHTIALQALNDYEAGTTVNVGIITGGGIRNVVPDEVTLEVDVRFKTFAERERIQEAIRNIPLTLEGTRKEVVFQKGTSPMEENEKGLELFELCRESAEKIGFSLGKQFVGGGSDANRISHLGMPLLDGLGPAGEGMHALHEQINLEWFYDRTAMLAAMLTKIK